MYLYRYIKYISKVSSPTLLKTKYKTNFNEKNFYLDDQEHLEVGEAGGDAAEDGAHLGGEELCGVEEGDGAEAERVRHGVHHHAEDRQPVEVAHDGAANRTEKELQGT